MKLADIVDYSSYCSIGCITSPENIDDLNQYITKNHEVISKFDKIIVAHTKTDNISYDIFEQYNLVWNKHYGNKVFVISSPNFGHTFGFTHLDRIVMNISKLLGVKYIWKSTNDVIVEPTIFNVDKGNEEFLYLNGYGYIGIVNENYNVDAAFSKFNETDYELFFPQTNFFIINSNIDFLIDPHEFNTLHIKCRTDSNYRKDTVHTEYKYMSSEAVLANCVKRNKLKRKMLISPKNYKKLLQYVSDFKIVDCSHKNIFFSECGVCHYHYKDQQVLVI